jgi:hypothetical protein
MNLPAEYVMMQKTLQGDEEVVTEHEGELWSLLRSWTTCTKCPKRPRRCTAGIASELRVPWPATILHCYRNRIAQIGMKNT